jgi:hypothetical protein
VFVPTHQAPAAPREASAAPKRRDHVAVPSASEVPRSLAWRAVVHSADNQAVHTSWHMTSCSSPLDPLAHCPAGQSLMDLQQDPDGHCLADGRCARCD